MDTISEDQLFKTLSNKNASYAYPKIWNVFFVFNIKLPYNNVTTLWNVDLGA